MPAATTKKPTASTAGHDEWLHTYFSQAMDDVRGHRAGRERTLALFLLVGGALAAFASTRSGDAWQLLMGIPILAFVATLDLARRNREIRAQLHYLAVDVCHANKMPTWWEASERRLALRRATGPGVLLVGALLGALPTLALGAAWWQWRETSATDWRLVVVAAGVSLFGSLVVLGGEFRERRRAADALALALSEPVRRVTPRKRTAQAAA